ncbi:T9SS type A sorting domain-containing protein [Bizionia sp. KMM 8389]
MFIVRFEPLPLSVEAFAASNFEVYPNPNQGSFNIKNPNNETYTVQIYNMLGQLVLETWF